MPFMGAAPARSLNNRWVFFPLCRHRPRSSAALFALTLLWMLPALAATLPSDSQLTELRKQLAHSISSENRVTLCWALSDALADRGLLFEAQRTLREAAVQSTTESQKRETALRLAQVLSATGELEDAERQLQIVQAGAPLPASQRLAMYEIEGNIAVRNGDPTSAERSFETQAKEAHVLGAWEVEARARINALRARLDRQDIFQLDERLDQLDALVGGLPSGQQRAVLELALGELFERAVREFRSPVGMRARAYEAITRGRADASSVGTQAYATGLLAGLYEDEGRTQEALRLTYQAIFLAQSVSAQDQLYRWEWQAGRLQRARGDGPASVQSLDRALFTLSGIRDDVLSSSRRAFSAWVEPIYLDYADVHLREAAGLPDGTPEQQRVLRDVRDQLESLKRAEVQDYFSNSCATSAASARDTTIPGAAIIYPVLLADRIEVLIETAGTLRRFASPISRGEVTATVRRLRIGLERPSAGDQYLKPAQALYQWMLHDASPWLANEKVDTLVFVPSGALRTIPLAALHDGTQFLIERYSVATTPAITLIPTLVSQGSNRVLVAGLTQSVQGFAALPSVDAEIHTVGALFPGMSLEDERFSLASIRADLSLPEFSIAHLATHGEFSADHRQSFVLTYDSRLTLDGLQTTLGRRQQPLDLLVLSACSTAAGDDRAALGLAGVAVQSGAKSALASLWSISDEATASLMSTFYKSRKSGGVSKAQSLRDAQLALLHTSEFRHPSYWAPYLMIGNWL